MSDPDLSNARRFLAAGSGACVAEVLSLPMDTAKVRLQLQSGSGAGAQYRGMFHAVRTIAVEEGPTALFKGVVPGCLRQMVFASLRIGLYEPVRNFYHPEGGEIPLYKKILAGFTTGTIGIAVANPTDLVKIRLQGEGRLAAGVPRRYTGTLNAFTTIARTEGVLGLWSGVGPNIVRNSVITAAELATYDEAKQRLLATGLFGDNVGTHMLSGVTAGFVATVVGSPVDVIKTRIMNQKAGAGGVRPYSGPIDCLVKIMKNEGPVGFYKGFSSNAARICSWNVFMFLAFEQFKILLSSAPAK